MLRSDQTASGKRACRWLQRVTLLTPIQQGAAVAGLRPHEGRMNDLGIQGYRAVDAEKVKSGAKDSRAKKSERTVQLKVTPLHFSKAISFWSKKPRPRPELLQRYLQPDMLLFDQTKTDQPFWMMPDDYAGLA